MTVAEALQASLSLFTVVGFIWKIARVESAIYKEIDSSEKRVKELYAALDKTLALQIHESQSSRSEIFYRLDGQGARLGGEIESLKKRASGAIVFERLELKIDDLMKKLP
ncbi:hypothetical protein [Nodularia sp. UHCC 0506]|uniref:hypothetical protein n=1 Tax=Nodularia sp. UHCC 0506 TaxID=3110243 RepID=UPI002B21DDFD|nr:hypothetical protein [Nodularia sp. UHCC 0506]MEA5516202.1 hypothetical protein [Nodularia sp. UHCC 0506]